MGWHRFAPSALKNYQPSRAFFSFGARSMLRHKLPVVSRVALWAGSHQRARLDPTGGMAARPMRDPSWTP